MLIRVYLSIFLIRSRVEMCDGTIEPSVNWVSCPCPGNSSGHNPMDVLAVSTASISAVLAVFCALLVWRLHRRLAAMETRLGSHGSAIRRLEGAHSDLITRSINSPKARRSRKKWSSPSSNTIQETSAAAPEQPDEKSSKGSALYVVAPKTSPE